MMGMHPCSSQAESEMLHNAASSLLPAWGSQEHTSCQLLLAPDEMARLLGSSTAAAATQLGDYLQAEARAAALHATQLQQDQQPVNQAAVQQQLQQQQQQQYQLLMQQQLQQQLDAAALDCQQDIDRLHWQIQQQQRQHQASSSHFQQQERLVQQQPAGQLQQQSAQQQQLQQQTAEPSPAVPALNLSRVKMGSSSPVRNLPEGEPVSEEVATKDAELCFERGSIRQHQLHPAAPLQDSRCYIYRAVGRKELSNLHDLLSRLPERECGEVLALWDALMVARHDCEVMAARGVRVSRDISRDWQETVSDLIDRVVAQDNELGQLRQQLKATQAAAAAAAASSPAAGSAAGMEELHAQVLRLKRQRDKLTRGQQELSRALAEAQEAAALARQEAAAAKDQYAVLSANAKALKDQHANLLRQHIELVAYAESLEAATPEVLPFTVAGLAAEADQGKPDQACKSPGGSFIVVAAKGGSGRRSPYAGALPAGCMDQLLQDGAGLAAADDATAEVALATAASRLGLAAVLPSRGSSPIGGLPAKAAAAVGEAAASSAASSRPRSSDDTPDRANDRLVGSTLAVLSKEVERYDQQAQAVHQLQLNVLGAVSKTPSRLMLQRPGVLAVGGWGEGWRPDLRSTLEAAQLQLELLDGLTL